MKVVELGRAAQAAAAPIQAKQLSASSRRSLLIPASARTKQAAFKSARPVVRTQAAPTEKPAPAAKIEISALVPDTVVEGTVRSVEAYGAFVDIGAVKDGLLHVSAVGEGFIKDIKQVLQPGQKIKARIVTVDAQAGRFALTTKGLLGAAVDAASKDVEAAEDEYDPYDAPEEDGEAVDVDVEEADEFEGPYADEGEDAVLVEDVPGFEGLAFIMDAEDDLQEGDITEVEAADDLQVEYESDVPPYMEQVTGQVARITEAGATVQFNWNGKQFEGLLTRDEMKVPASALNVIELEDAAKDAGVIGDEDELPEADEARKELLLSKLEALVEPRQDDFPVSRFYKVGTEVTAYVLNPGFDGIDEDESNAATDNMIELTMFADFEVDQQAWDMVNAVEEDEADDDDEALEEYVQSEFDRDFELAAVSPEELLEVEESSLGPFMDTDDELNAADRPVTDRSAGPMLRNRRGQLTLLDLESRPVDMSTGRFSSVAMRDTDKDGDVIELDDYWTVDYHVPKNALAKSGLKIAFNEEGEAEVVPKKEGEELPVFSFNSNDTFSSSSRARARAILKDLLAAEEDEAELPALAGRKPVVLAAAVASVSAGAVKQLRDKTGAGMMDCKKALAECDGDTDKAIEWLRKKGLAGADKKAGRLAAEGGIFTYIHPGNRLGVMVEINSETDFVAAGDVFNKLANEIAMVIAATPEVKVVRPEDVPPELLAKEKEVEMGKEDLANKPEAIRAKIVEGRVEKIKQQMALLNQPCLSDNSKTIAEKVKETIASVGENIQIRRFVKYQLGEGLEKKANDFAAEVAAQTQAKSEAPKPKEAPKAEPKKEEPAKPKVEVSAAIVKQLRDKTGAGMMDCKKALAENSNDIEKSVEWLRQKGLASADKKAGRLAAEGAVVSYVHPGSRLGVLLELNCETDFVAMGEKFLQLASAIAMTIAAAPGVQYVSAEEIPAEVFEREKQAEMQREDLLNKPEAIRAKIAEGRARKIAQEMALLDQPYLLDQSKTVGEAVKEAVAAIGEKISVRRFVKYQLGEGLEKKSNDFAAEVAAATGKN